MKITTNQFQLREQKTYNQFQQITFQISLKTDKDTLVQLQNTRIAIERLFGTILKDTKGFKFVETMKVIFIKRKDDIYRGYYMAAQGYEFYLRVLKVSLTSERSGHVMFCLFYRY